VFSKGFEIIILIEIWILLLWAVKHFLLNRKRFLLLIALATLVRVVSQLFYFYLNNICKSPSYKKLFLFVCAKHGRLMDLWFAVCSLEWIVVYLLFLFLQLLEDFNRVTLFKNLFTSIVSAFVQGRTLL
jgi:hypothetical protein